LEKVTFTAKTQEEALSMAAQQFQVPVNIVEYRIIESGAKGLFGIGTKDWVIEAWVEPDDLVKNFLNNLLEKMDFASEVFCIKKEEGIYVELESSYAGAIIGRRGETLDAIQYLTTLYVNKFYSNENYIRVIIDIENYRSKREEALIRLANGVAAKVIRYRKEIVLEPMTPFERRIIHSALQNNKKVVSRSIGSEPHRKVVISLSV
jgi:spoIIIJ-associated protein